MRSHLAAIGSGDDLEAHLTHIGLHKAIWDLADSPTLRKIWPLVGSQIHVSLTVDQAVRHDPERDATLHRRLVRVIEEGDEATIVAEVEEHIRRSVDEVLRRLTQGDRRHPAAGYATESSRGRSRRRRWTRRGRRRAPATPPRPAPARRARDPAAWSAGRSDTAVSVGRAALPPSLPPSLPPDGLYGRRARATQIVW